MIETEKKQERILLVGVELQGMDNFDMSMEELASLAKTAGGDVRGSYTQKREKYDTKTFVGSGKLEEISQMVEAGGSLEAKANSFLELSVSDCSSIIIPSNLSFFFSRNQRFNGFKTGPVN